MSKTNPSDQELTYEQAYAELEGIVAALESGEHTLEEAMKLFERGQALSKHYAELLEKTAQAYYHALTTGKPVTTLPDETVQLVRELRKQ